MSDCTDTGRFDYEGNKHESPHVQKRKSFWSDNFPLLVVVVSAVLVLVFVLLAVAVKERKKQERLSRAGTLTARYIDEAKSITSLKDGVIRPMPPLNRVIFRLDGVEIFRFTYEGGRDGQKFSFEVVEGSQ